MEKGIQELQRVRYTGLALRETRLDEYGLVERIEPDGKLWVAFPRERALFFPAEVSPA